MSFSYVLKSRKGARGVRIAVHADGAVVVTKPVRIPKIIAEAFVKSRTDWILEQLKEVEKRPKKLLAHHSLVEYKENKQKAFVIAHNRVLYFNQFYDHVVKTISIRNQKTRWGSCSGKGNLNFNYKIAFLPAELADYIVVHELCHLKEMNHGKKFWDLVAQQVPDYKMKREKIKLY